jgi:hypothetical protein
VRDDLTANAEDFVHFGRAAATVGNTPHRDPIAVRARWVAAQRVLPYPPTGQVDVKVCTGTPGWQRRTVGAGERQRHHVLIVGDHPAAHHRQRDAAVAMGRRRDTPDRSRQRPQCGDRGVGEAEQHVVRRATRGARRRLPEPVKDTHQR